MKPLYGNIDDVQYIKELEAKGYHAVEEIERLTTEGAVRNAKIEELRKFIDLQAEDEGLWYFAETAAEDVVQRGLRGCHAMFEQLFPASSSQKTK